MAICSAASNRLRLVLQVNLTLRKILLEPTGAPFQLTIGWIEQQGRARFKHDDDLIVRYLLLKEKAGRREGPPRADSPIFHSVRRFKSEPAKKTATKDSRPAASSASKRQVHIGLKTLTPALVAALRKS